MLYICYAAALVIAYLLGSLNSALIVSKYILKNDVRKHGSGNAGLTNFYRAFGGRETFLVLLGDIMKCVIGMLVGGALIGSQTGNYQFGRILSGVFVLVGHMFPAFFRFKGGKGVLSGAALVVMFDWRIGIIVLTVFILIVFFTRYVSLGSIMGAVAFGIMGFILYRDAATLVLIALVSCSVVFMHRANIKRLLSGTESKFAFKKK